MMQKYFTFFFHIPPKQVSDFQLFPVIQCKSLFSDRKIKSIMYYNKTNNLLAWLCFLIATTTYILTLEPTASFWDAGEFIAAAYKMQIVHQPGAPLFLMLQNLFSNFAMGNKELIAYWMNMGSAVSSGFTI